MTENVESTRCSWSCAVLFAALASLVAVFCLIGSASFAHADTVESDTSSTQTIVPSMGNETSNDQVAVGTTDSSDASDDKGEGLDDKGDAATTAPAPADESNASQSAPEAKPVTGDQTSAPVAQKPEKKPTKAGWMQDSDGAWYYFMSANAKPSTGWVKSGSKWYWMQADKNGAMATSAWITDGGKRYYVDAAGVMKTGWFKIGSDWYHANKSGVVQQSGWVKSGSKWYWLQADQQGKMAVGAWIVDKGKRYYLNGSGVMATKWFKVDSDWYYATKSGAVQQSGWLKSGGKWYWLQADQQGLMLADQVKVIDGKQYSFGSSGAMHANCQVDLGDGIARYAASSGAISRLGEYKDGEVVLTNASGQILTGWQKIAGKWFYGEAGTGIAQKGWLKLGRTWYYLDSNAAMVTGTRTIDGKANLFSSSGKWLGTDAMTSKAQGYSSGTNWLILVDRGAHRVGVFNGSKGNWNRTQTFSCVTGAPGSQTITGVFRTTGGKRMNLSTDSRARWCTQISGGYFFHTILASESELGHSLSHGCIRLAIPNAQWIYNNISAGTTVVIYN